ncbi:MAG: hypothetical protein ACKN9E_06120 [Microcystaceae cyanobacterium]
MSLSLSQAYQKVLEIYQVMETKSQRFGRLLNWYEGMSWHYGIGLNDTLIFDTASNNIFEKNPSEVFEVPDVQKFTPQETIERLCYALVCFREWHYGLLGWNCEHIARLVASDQAVSYEVKKCLFPIPQMNHDGWHPEAQRTLQEFIEQNPNLLSHIFFEVIH